jgi:hypothetical protein
MVGRILKNPTCRGAIQPIVQELIRFVSQDRNICPSTPQ